MSLSVTAKDALTTSQILDNLGNCNNIKVGSNKYQLYCLSTTDMNGSCILLSSRYMINDTIICSTVTSQSFLEKLYKDTANFCTINCFDPRAQVQVSATPAYSYSYSYTYSYSQSYSYETPVPTTTAATRTVSTAIAASTGSDMSVSAPSGSRSVSPLPTNRSSKMCPNLLITFMIILAIVSMFTRKILTS
ncbi:hypothetical protein [Parasitella parasitica]|uniref:Uncharacterized protein n=1 Tax=Parasitella parasitica TaxID=35722 RepID=A0A0B7NHA8_9FUNG|nr:hypothetical protein [Parasitella parasitica]